MNAACPVVILVAEDDEDDYVLMRDALKEAMIVNDLYRVKDGVELMDYLLHQGPYKKPSTAPRPLLVLLDLNMPRKDGRTALKEIKSHPDLRGIPVIVLTTSKAEEDIVRSYDLGANSFIRKPVSFEQFVHVMKDLKRYWLEVVEIPQPL